MNKFKEGYDFFINIIGNIEGSLQSDEYVENVNNEIEKLVGDLNNFKGTKTDTSQLKGDVFEFWHSDTFNIDAVVKGKNSRTFVDRSNEFGSVDISSNFGKEFGLKAYANGTESAKAQSVSVFQRFKEYQAKGGNDTLSEFLRKRNYDNDTILSDPIYSGQIRIIPRDQLEEATKWLKKIIKTEENHRPEQVHRYQETLDMLNDRLADNKGTESIPLSKSEAERLAKLAKEGKIEAEELGLTSEELMKYKYVLGQSLKAGLTSAVITMVLKTAPEIYKAIDYLIKEGAIDGEQFKKIGFAAISGATEGFIRGTISAAITTCCKTGLLGSGLKPVDPTIIGAVTVITINVFKGAYSVAKKEKARSELVNDLIRDMYISTFSLIGGGIFQGLIEIPILGYMLGSFIGSIIGTFAYNVNQKAVISFCIDSGFTMFGIVEQDYALPQEIIKEIGIETFDYEKVELDSFKPKTFNFDTFSYDTFELETIGIKYLRRGVIGVNKIGYI